MSRRKAKPDPAFVGATLELRGAFDPRALAAKLSLVPSRTGRRGEAALDPFGKRIKGRAVWPDDWALIPIDPPIDPEHAVTILIAALRRLPPSARRTWRTLRARSLSLGLSSRRGSFCADFGLPPDSLRDLARWRVSLNMTWYWPSSEDFAAWKG